MLPFGRLWHDGPDAAANAIGDAEHYSRSHAAGIRAYDAAGNVIETHEHTGDFKEWFVPGIYADTQPQLQPYNRFGVHPAGEREGT